MRKHATGKMQWLSLVLVFVLALPLHAQEAGDAPETENDAPSQTSEPAADPDADADATSASTPTIPVADPEERPRDVFRPSEEIWADSALSFPVDI